MPTVAVVTDSSACLPADLLAVHRITTVPLSFEFDGAVHRDGSLSSGDFFALLRSARRFPTTSSPAPAEFLEAYREASHAADAVLCATLPAAFSGTYASALAAAELAAGQLPGLTVRVVDTHCLAMGPPRSSRSSPSWSPRASASAPPGAPARCPAPSTACSA
jgi:DegV family protein with EDD domain